MLPRTIRESACILALVLTCFWPVASAQTTQRADGDCSPNLSQVDIAGDLTLNCGAGRRELERLTRGINALLSRDATNKQLSTAVAKGLNEALPSFSEQLQRLEGKQDRQDAAIAEILALVKVSLTAKTPEQVADKIAEQRNKLLHGVELSECGCWGHGAYYGNTTINLECLSGREILVACRAKSGDNVCSRGFFEGFIFNQAGYSPWQRICN